jgi:hypothetical protein
MHLSWNEIRDRATLFQKRWKAAEKANPALTLKCEDFCCYFLP